MHYIYKYINKVNGKIYVGQTTNFKRRHRWHKKRSKNGEDGCPLFYRAVRKYGWEAFKYKLICTAKNQQEADKLEKYWIKILDTTNPKKGYNISPGGGGRANPNNTKTHKQCTECKQVKLRTHFGRRKNSHDGNCSRCFECFRAKQKEKRHALPKDVKTRWLEKRRAKYAEKTKEARLQREKNKKKPLKPKEAAKKQREIYKEHNLKLTKEEIYKITPFKECRLCKKEMPSTSFYIDITRKDGLGRVCKNHLRKENASIFDIKIQSEKYREINKKLSKDEIRNRTPYKICKGCKQKLESLYFHINITRKDGLHGSCKNCEKKYKLNKDKEKCNKISRKCILKYKEDND